MKNSGFAGMLFALFAACGQPHSKQNNMPSEQNLKADQQALSQLNAQFIQNFITQNVAAHDNIIHPDFVCIQPNGEIVGREKYLSEWATDYENSGLDTFTYTDEYIRIFGDIALVRSKTTATKIVDGKITTGESVYTDTYWKENGRWRCIQAQMTPVRK